MNRTSKWAIAIVSLLLVIALIGTLCACNDDPHNQDDNNPPSDNPGGNPTDNPSDNPSDNPNIPPQDNPNDDPPDEPVVDTNEYTITFIADSILISSQKFTLVNPDIQVPSVPQKVGYVGEWEEYTLFAGQVDVHAVYTAKQYSVALDYSGADGNSQQTVVATYGQLLPKLPVPTKTNCVFDGWYWGVDEVTSQTMWQTDSDDVTFTAHWTVFSDGLQYALNADNNTYSVVGVGVSLAADLVIPSTFNSKAVTNISAGAFTDCQHITRLTITENISSIDAHAFDGCSRIEKITVVDGNTAYHSSNNCLIHTSSKALVFGCKNSVIPQDGSVTSIADGAFCKCIELLNADIPDGVVSIGETAFSGCRGLASVTIPQGVRSIGNSAFSSCVNLQEVSLPNSVEFIGDNVFDNCVKLQYNMRSEVKYLGNADNMYVYLIGTDNQAIDACAIPQGTKHIAVSAFDGCSYLGIVSIPSSVITIGRYAFRGCSNLSAVTIPSGVKKIAEYTFYECSNLSALTIESGVVSIGDNAFGWCSRLTEVTVPNGVESLADNVFNYCSSLEKLEIADSVKSIGNGVLFGCNSLKELTVPFLGATAADINGATVSYLFTRHADGQIAGTTPPLLKKISVNGGERVGSYAFYNCGELVTVILSESITSIGDYAFYDCNSLQSVTLGSKVTYLGDFAFSGCNNLDNLDLPSSLINIGNGAFEWCSRLTRITLPNKVEILGNNVFKNCGELKRVDLPASINSIGAGAFSSCGKLETVYYDSALKNWCNIVFGGEFANPMQSGADVYIGNEAVVELTVSDGITKIDGYAFAGCDSLQSVTIGVDVAEINSCAFAGCNNLSVVHYEGTTQQWSSVKKTDDWLTDTLVDAIICDDGTVYL